jgi:hypothetical protein
MELVGRMVWNIVLTPVERRFGYETIETGLHHETRR